MSIRYVDFWGFRKGLKFTSAIQWEFAEMSQTRDEYRRPPTTYRANPETIKAQLTYQEIVALAGLFRRWAIYEDLKPERRTRAIMWSADLDEIAQWVGIDWRPAETWSGDILLKSLAMAARQHSTVVWVGV